MHNDGDESAGNIAARLEWWRRASFTLLGVIIFGIGGWFAVLSDNVGDNRQAITGIYAELTSLRAAIEAGTEAQRATALQLAELAGQLEGLRRNGAGGNQ